MAEPEAAWDRLIELQVDERPGRSRSSRRAGGRCLVCAARSV